MTETETETEDKMTATLQRTWGGEKPFNYLDPETGKRRKVLKGETIAVSPHQAEVFEANMIDPKVAEAQKVAKKAQEEAKAQTKQAAGTKSGQSSASKASTSASASGSGSGSGV